jgi:hypothetical protein
MRVAFLAPILPGLFYDLVADFMQVAARQLGIDLEIVDATHDRGVMLQRGLELSARGNRPDYVIFPNYLSIAMDLLPAFGAAGVGGLVAFEGMDAGASLMLGQQGRSRYLGEIIPDDLEAGRLLAEVLVAEARQRGMADAGGKVNVGIVAGMQTQVTNLRFRGWQKFKNKSSNAVQAGFGYGGRNETEAKATAKMLLARAPETRVLWCFNDAMALGAMSAAMAAGRKPGEDILIGGFDLLDRALEAIREGTMHASAGGHIVDGVRALLLLFDHEEKGDLRASTRMTRMEVVKADAAERYLRFMKDRAWRNADFARFSARRNPGGSPRELSLSALVEASDLVP